MAKQNKKLKKNMDLFIFKKLLQTKCYIRIGSLNATKEPHRNTVIKAWNSVDCLLENGDYTFNTKMYRGAWPQGMYDFCLH